MARVLHKTFFNRSTTQVAQDLLGKQLCRRLEYGKILRARITETEAYDGFEDKASHAHKGATTRNVVMFGPPGRTYIYLCYGVHWLLNLTTREKGYPAAVLIRGVEGVDGPGRTTKFFQLDSQYNDQQLSRVHGLWIEDDGLEVDPSQIRATPRVGVDYAGPEWSQMPWRYVWQRNG
ncbi:DNA-3-methyladenine glycosylase [Coraliomargarita akajimensis]|uniref:Putative 3-methyladenine DNA glycosylase n=1 Tax=Coraliomargarita akajimensis (strain DSM 45221 / IAM 15411 / JCM 23193 / KCTC 12865 / 04OKA010-24) TaxID=583355 RepID=D5EIG2_CORAD|nr:DNA-3-methyladenine glycosylase [Coraliomargarita akajimensis]ADE54228.1 DNA-3-methyladenine glycosylase [Coraliomargarita akajimensis DSM 45221]